MKYFWPGTKKPRKNCISPSRPRDEVWPPNEFICLVFSSAFLLFSRHLVCAQKRTPRMSNVECGLRKNASDRVMDTFSAYLTCILEKQKMKTRGGGVRREGEQF